jgi:hypothetical protein
MSFEQSSETKAAAPKYSPISLPEALSHIRV